MPVELSAARYPDGDPDPWIQALVAARWWTSIDQQLGEWLATGPAGRRRPVLHLRYRADRPRVRASMFELLRLMGGRRSLGQLAATGHDGDLMAHLPGLVHLDPLEHDLVE